MGKGQREKRKKGRKTKREVIWGKETKIEIKR